ncbi:MAG: flagellar basal body P-ring formation chaperone FlgA [Phycisphaerales bacterium JB040]
MIKALAILTLLLTPAVACQVGVTSVTLRPGVRVEANTPVTLADVASIQGPDADRLSALVVGENRDELRGEVGVARVRELVLTHLPESAVVVRGTACTLIVRGDTARNDRNRGDRVSEPELPGPEGSVRGQIEAHLLALYGVDEQSARFTFEERDAALLGRSVAGRAVELRVTGSGRRVPLSVAVYEGARVVVEGTVRVEVQLKRDVALAAGDLDRGAVLGPRDLVIESRWVDADADVVEAAEAIGRVVRRRVRTGEALVGSELESPVVVHRGDVVMIRSVVGAAAVRLRGRALADARAGEVIEFESAGATASRSDRRRYSATVLGPGRAIIAPPSPTVSTFSSPESRAQSKGTDA